MSEWGYKEISAGDSRRKNGMVLEHRYVAEKMIGRPLTRKEVVHHKDENRSNNSEDNLMVFATQSDHSRFHKGGVLVEIGDGTYRCEHSSSTTKPCPVCGAATTNRVYCSPSCAHKSQRKERPPKELLEALLTTETWVGVGRLYNVSDNTVRNWAKSYGIF